MSDRKGTEAPRPDAGARPLGNLLSDRFGGAEIAGRAVGSAFFV